MLYGTVSTIPGYATRSSPFFYSQLMLEGSAEKIDNGLLAN